MKYIGIMPDKGIVLKKSKFGFDLLVDSDLKLLSLCDVQEPQKFEVCRLNNGNRVFVLNIKDKASFKIVTPNDKLTDDAYLAVICLETKMQVSYLSNKVKNDSQKTVLWLMGAIERIFSRGKVNKSWLKEE